MQHFESIGHLARFVREQVEMVRADIEDRQPISVILARLREIEAAVLELEEAEEEDDVEE